MNLVSGHDQTVISWASKVNGGLGRTPDVALGIIDRDGVLVGALLLHTYNPWTVELEVHGRVSNGVARQFFPWVFAQGVTRLEIKAAKNNKGTKKAAPKWGFAFDGVRKRYYGPHGDALCWFMTPATCRWLKKEEAYGIEA
jgi:hypothetical protein